jgi:tRNA (cytidine/uridine-2'-O-)-methyltransferase
MAATELHVVLVAPEIHWNTGNAARTCLAAGATLHLVAPLGFSLDAKEVRRAGLDYWPRVDLRLWSGWDEIEPSLTELGESYFFSPEAGRTLWETSYADRAVLVFGCETRGLPRAIREAIATGSCPFP